MDRNYETDPRPVDIWQSAGLYMSIPKRHGHGQVRRECFKYLLHLQFCSVLVVDHMIKTHTAADAWTPRTPEHVISVIVVTTLTVDPVHVWPFGSYCRGLWWETIVGRGAIVKRKLLFPPPQNSERFNISAVTIEWMKTFRLV